MPLSVDDPNYSLMVALCHEVGDIARKLSEREQLVLKAAAIVISHCTGEQLVSADQRLQETECCSCQELLKQRIESNQSDEFHKKYELRTPNTDEYMLLGKIKERRRVDELLRQAITQRLERLAKLSPEDAAFLDLVQKYFEIEMLHSSWQLRMKTDILSWGSFRRS